MMPLNMLDHMSFFKANKVTFGALETRNKGYGKTFLLLFQCLELPRRNVLMTLEKHQ